MNHNGTRAYKGRKMILDSWVVRVCKFCHVFLPKLHRSSVCSKCAKKRKKEYIRNYMRNKRCLNKNLT
jgi:hypothetical protein